MHNLLYIESSGRQLLYSSGLVGYNKPEVYI